MTTTLLIIALITACATLAGGFFALRFKDKSHLIVGFSAGAVIGVAFFDLLPEAIGLSGNISVAAVTAFVALGFFVYLILDRFFYTTTNGNESTTVKHIQEHGHRGKLRAGSLSVHSLLDGIGIGLAFHVSLVVGTVVAVAVLVHDFSDGINTVGAVVKGGGTKRQATRWLLVDAAAPIAGIVATLFFSVSETLLGILLALFCGFFLYIGASDLIPESYHSHPTKWTTIATILGATGIYIAIHLAG